MEKSNWESFFDAYAPQYKDEPYVHNTQAEVDFLEHKFGLQPGMSILDAGCGTGRHSLEFARRGYQVTGVDLSEQMLQEAKNAAASENLQVDFIKANLVDLTLDKRFDLAVCLCEGGFGLLGVGEQPFLRDVGVLKNLHACLKNTGRFFMTTLNGYRFIRQYQDTDVENGTFDNIHCVEHLPIEEYTPSLKGLTLSQKGFTPSEMQLMLYLAGFVCEGIAGGTAGHWNEKKLQMDEMELMVWARKAA